ncbi:sulfur oxidation c-type cytochrome SoxA [Benzoatithermus flavus]|uniref:L-cysteine S-thiosulfotransferase subunit SoxA n=1 Tax=Benzoatithermus flavus TaxID=3108223 RepID=A0ABU8XU12_9PROT
MSERLAGTSWHRPWALLAGALAVLAGAVAAGAAEVPLDLEGPAAATPWQRYPGWPTTRWPGFSTLADTTRSPSPPAPGALRPVVAPIAGDPVKGRKLAFDRSRGGACVACHVMGPDTPELPGNVGPDLSEIGKADRSDEYLFNYVWDARVYNPETVMPPWGAHGYYDAAEIGDIVAFLKTLDRPASFANPLDDPARRPVPVEDRDWTDPFVNPAQEDVATGAGLFEEPGPSGRSCAACHADPKTAFRSWAAHMPRWEPRLGKVLGVAEFVTRHARPTTGAEWPMESTENLAMTVYLTSLADGERIAVDTTSPGAKEAAERGRRLMETKIGQANFACTDCHGLGKGAGRWIRGQYLGETPGQVAHFPTWRTSRNQTWDIRKRLQWCNVQIRADDLPPDAAAYGELELYLTSLSNGMELAAPGIRH